MRRDKIRRAIQSGADEQGVDITEADENKAVEFLDNLLPKDAEVFESFDELFEALAEDAS